MPNLDMAPAEWRKSTYSGDGGHCVESTVTWRNSSGGNQNADA